MLEMLKKLGLPITAAAIIASLITATPLLFKIDERYAKEEDLKSAVSKLEQQNEKLMHELAQNAGFQQAMIAILSKQSDVRPVDRIEEPLRMTRPSRAPAAVLEAPPPTPTVESPIEKPKNLKDLSEGLLRQEQRLLIPTPKKD